MNYRDPKSIAIAVLSLMLLASLVALLRPQKGGESGSVVGAEATRICGSSSSPTALYGIAKSITARDGQAPLTVTPDSTGTSMISAPGGLWFTFADAQRLSVPKAPEGVIGQKVLILQKEGRIQYATVTNPEPDFDPCAVKAPWA